MYSVGKSRGVLSAYEQLNKKLPSPIPIKHKLLHTIMSVTHVFKVVDGLSLEIDVVSPPTKEENRYSISTEAS